jgi:hypothetical protein
VSPALAQRLVILGGAALLAVVAALAVAAIAGGDDTDAAETTPGSIPAPDGGWYTALAGPQGFAEDAEQTECGYDVGDDTLGVAHPVLPCGTKLWISYGETMILTQVVDRTRGGPDREFGMTGPLARKVGLGGVERIRWRFAG